MEGIAWASYAGGVTFSLAAMPVGGGLGVALTATGLEGKMQNILRDNSPADLKKLNRQALLKIGATGKDADGFLANDAFSPTAQTAFVLNLQSLDGVKNRGALVRLVGAPAAPSPTLFPGSRPRRC